MSRDELIDAALEAHRESIRLQTAMREAAARRDDAVREAIEAGVPVKPLAEALGVDRQRIYQMARR